MAPHEQQQQQQQVEEHAPGRWAATRPRSRGARTRTRTRAAHLAQGGKSQLLCPDLAAPTTSESAAHRLAPPPPTSAPTATARQVTNVQRSRGSCRRLLLAGALAVLVLATCQLSCSHAAVIRPTIFSDLPPDSVPSAAAAAAAAAANGASAQQQQQQSQPQQVLPANQQPSGAAASSNPSQATAARPAPGAGGLHIGQTHWQQHAAQHQHQADGAAQTQKISPLKSRFCAGPSGARQDQPLGMQSYAIDDLSLSASSFSNEQVRPHLARLNLDALGGAWCPSKAISSSNFGKEWIQVKLNRSFVVSALETQGRFAMGSGKEFVPSYQIEYSRNNGLTWHKWKDFRGSSLLRANEDANTAVRNELSPPIVGANVIRILPFSAHLRTVCLRFELYGCQYDEGAPISYATSDGVVEPRWGHLIDYTYDGLRQRSGQLSGGLGQLVDGVKGPDNFSFNNGFEWVGWKSMNGDVVVEFAFKTLRNFTGALFHSNNLFSAGVEVFQAVDVHYGVDVALSTESLRDALHERERRERHLRGLMSGGAGGPLARAARQSPVDGGGGLEPSAGAASTPGTLWSQDVLSIEYEPDKKAESSRPVTVHLKQRLANKLRFHLKFASKWILLSEVEFLSRPVELMSLASLNEQLTPKLTAELALARTYDQYVAILREHQLRRIAADEYLLTLASGGAGAGASSTTPTSVGAANQQQDSAASAQEAQPNDQQQQQQQQQDQLAGNRIAPGPTLDGAAPSQETLDDYVALAGRRQATAPELNPFLGPSPYGLPGQNSLESQQQQQATGSLFDKAYQAQQNDQQQQTQQIHTQASGSRTPGLATVISFAFVALLALVGLLFALSSYRLRCRSPKLGSPTALPRYALDGGARAVATDKGYLDGVFAVHALDSAQCSDSSSSAAGSFVGNAHAAHTQQQQQQQQHFGVRHSHAYASASGDSHYNPLFASTSGRSSEGSLSRRPASSKRAAGAGALGTLRKLASLTTGRGGACSGASASSSAAAAAKLAFQRQQATLVQARREQPGPSQLLVSLKDSISAPGAKPFSGQTSSQVVTGQLIVGLNQANPLAHQQIYNQQALYGTGQQQQAQAQAQAQQQHYSPNSATNSMSLTASSSSRNANNGAQRPGGGGDYSLAASADYATPDLQAPFAPEALQPFGARNSTRIANVHLQQQQQRMLMAAEHNYEQISGDQPPAGGRFAGASTLHHQHQHNNNNNNSASQAHQRTLSNLAQQQQAGGAHHNALCAPHDAWRLARQQQQQADSSSHYYYADTEAARSCLGAGAGVK